MAADSRAAPLAVVSAMHEELRALLGLLEAPQLVRLGGREFHTGRVHGRPLVLVLSGIGKVAAGITATLLLAHFGVEQIVFTGVAGGLGAAVRVGDVVLARQLLQHDMDASPLFPRHEVPLTGRSRFVADGPLCEALARAAERCLASAPALLGAQQLAAFGITAPRLHHGLVLSGDRFISTRAESSALLHELPDALAVEMEGAAVAQVCGDFNVPFAVLRSISDRADDSAQVDFQRFIVEVASLYTRAIVTDWLLQPPA